MRGLDLSSRDEDCLFSVVVSSEVARFVTDGHGGKQFLP